MDRNTQGDQTVYAAVGSHQGTETAVSTDSSPHLLTRTEGSRCDGVISPYCE
jgi:hypothetical protein